MLNGVFRDFPQSFLEIEDGATRHDCFLLYPSQQIVYNHPATLVDVIYLHVEVSTSLNEPTNENLQMIFTSMKIFKLQRVLQDYSSLTMQLKRFCRI
jgi:hypothetical protein